LFLFVILGLSLSLSLILTHTYIYTPEYEEAKFPLSYLFYDTLKVIHFMVENQMKEYHDVNIWRSQRVF